MFASSRKRGINGHRSAHVTSTKLACVHLAWYWDEYNRSRVCRLTRFIFNETTAA